MILKYSTIYILFIGTLLSCNKPKTESSRIPTAPSNTTSVAGQNTVQPVSEAQYEGLADGKYSKTIRDGNTVAEVFYTVEKGLVDYYQLTVKSGNNTQKLHAVSNWGFSNIDQTEFSFEDVNFDGKKDIMIAKETGMNWGTSYVWINKNGKFVKEEKFEKIMNPHFDSVKKEIRSEYRISGEGDFSRTYRWKKGNLILTDSSEYLYGPDGN
ncbi:XAC2610-related protein [Chryseobacterium sp. Mn2064]|uniref:XAC2610-related protein n=1 Tax=Chryseobacterium sp. Mn2064 TaxID=3395263 RepID=UPI003BCEDB6C